MENKFFLRNMSYDFWLDLIQRSLLIKSDRFRRVININERTNTLVMIHIWATLSYHIRGSDQWRVLVNTVIVFRVSYQAIKLAQ